MDKIFPPIKVKYRRVGADSWDSYTPREGTRTLRKGIREPAHIRNLLIISGKKPASSGERYEVHPDDKDTLMEYMEDNNIIKGNQDE